MKKNKILSNLFSEYSYLYRTLYENKYIIEHRDLSYKPTGDDIHEITWSGRSPEANITFSNVEISKLVNELLSEEQFSFLFYDKSILQVEYTVESETIVKQRMQFIKKCNYVRSIEEVEQLEGYSSEVEGPNWFEEEEGVPVYLRVDYDPENHQDILHSKSHFVISNLKDCRIPMSRNLSLTKFVEFILHQVYNEYSIELKESLIHSEEITDNEKLFPHLSW